MAATVVNRIGGLRRHLGVTQKVMARLVGVTERTAIDLEGGRELSEAVRRRMTELERLVKALANVVRKDSVGDWLTRPNEAFDGDTPVDLVAKGKSDLLWKMIFELRSGVSS